MHPAAYTRDQLKCCTDQPYAMRMSGRLHGVAPSAPAQNAQKFSAAKHSLALSNARQISCSHLSSKGADKISEGHNHASAR
jgi:hypothetical protein